MLIPVPDLVALLMLPTPGLDLAEEFVRGCGKGGAGGQQYILPQLHKIRWRLQVL